MSAALAWDGPAWDSFGETALEVLHWGHLDQPLRSWVAVECSDGRPDLYLQEGPDLGPMEWDELTEDVRASWDGNRTLYRGLP